MRRRGRETIKDNYLLTIFTNDLSSDLYQIHCEHNENVYNALKIPMTLYNLYYINILT